MLSNLSVCVLQAAAVYNVRSWHDDEEVRQIDGNSYCDQFCFHFTHSFMKNARPQTKWTVPQLSVLIIYYKQYMVNLNPID